MDVIPEISISEVALMSLSLKAEKISAVNEELEFLHTAETMFSETFDFLA